MLHIYVHNHSPHAWIDIADHCHLILNSTEIKNWADDIGFWQWIIRSWSSLSTSASIESLCTAATNKDFLTWHDRCCWLTDCSFSNWVIMSFQNKRKLTRLLGQSLNNRFISLACRDLKLINFEILNQLKDLFPTTLGVISMKMALDNSMQLISLHRMH